MNCDCCGMDYVYRTVGSLLLCDSCFEIFASDFGPSVIPPSQSGASDGPKPFRGSRSPLLGGSPTPFPAAPDSFNEGDMSD